MKVLGLDFFRGGVQLSAPESARVRELKNVDFKTQGAPKLLGNAKRPSGFGKVVSFGPARGATLIVGLNKGNREANRTGACAIKPAKFSPTQVDETFIDVRTGQVGAKSVGATRAVGKGWYEGAPEKSVAYSVVYIKNDREKTYATFKRNMEELAERIGGKLCQDSVLIIHDNSDKRRTRSAER